MIYLLATISLAAVLNAFMDITENENFHSSKLKNLNQRFWYKRESWKWAKKFWGWKADGWHVAKSLMVVLIISAMSNSWLQFIILGVVWNVSFNLTYKWLKK